MSTDDIKEGPAIEIHGHYESRVTDDEDLVFEYVMDDSRGPVVALPLTNEQVTSNLICMHCATPLQQVKRRFRLEVHHPPLPNNTDPMDGWLCVITPGMSAQEALQEIGKVIRHVHRNDDESSKKQEVTEVMPALPEPQKTEYQEVVPNNHMSWELRQLMGPHIQAIGSLLHIVPMLQDMEQWTFTVTDPCGLDASIVLRVKRMGCQRAQPGRNPSSDDLSGSSGNDDAESSVPPGTNRPTSGVVHPRATTEAGNQNMGSSKDADTSTGLDDTPVVHGSSPE